MASDRCPLRFNASSLSNNFLARRSTICSRNVAIHIMSDHIVRQMIMFYYYRSLPRWTSTTFFTWRKMLFSEWHRYTPRKRKMKTLATGFEPTNFQLELWTLYPWAIGDSCRGKLGHDTKSEVANFGLTVSMGLSICVAYADDDENEDGKFKPAWSFK